MLIKRKRNKRILIWRRAWQWFLKNGYTKKTTKLLLFNILRHNLSKLETTFSSILWKKPLHITFNVVSHTLASWCSVWHYGWSDFNLWVDQLYHHNRYCITLFCTCTSIFFFPIYCKSLFFAACFVIKSLMKQFQCMIWVFWYLQAYAAEAGAERAEEPMEEAGMSDEIIQKASIVHCRDSL